MKALDFTKETDELENKLIKLGFHYQSTDKEERPPKPARLITTWANVMNGVTLQIIDTYDELRDENYELITIPRKYVRITDDCTNISVTMSVDGKHGTVMSGKLKKSAPTTPSSPTSRPTPSAKKTYPTHWGTGKTFTSSCTCRTKSTTISKQPYTRTRNYKWKTNTWRAAS